MKKIIYSLCFFIINLYISNENKFIIFGTLLLLDSIFILSLQYNKKYINIARISCSIGYILWYIIKYKTYDIKILSLYWYYINIAGIIYDNLKFSTNKTIFQFLDFIITSFTALLFILSRESIYSYLYIIIYLCIIYIQYILKREIYFICHTVNTLK